MEKLIKNNIIVELHIPDFSLAKDFYSKLGFEIIIEDKKGGFPGYLVIQRQDKLGKTMLNFYGDDERVFQQAYFKKFSPQTPRGYAVEITILVSSISNFYKQVFKTLKNYIIQELMEKKDSTTSWQDFRLVCPFGFYIRVTELIDWGQ